MGDSGLAKRSCATGAESAGQAGQLEIAVVRCRPNSTGIRGAKMVVCPTVREGATIASRVRSLVEGGCRATTVTPTKEAVSSTLAPYVAVTVVVRGKRREVSFAEGREGRTALYGGLDDATGAAEVPTVHVSPSLVSTKESEKGRAIGAKHG